MSADLTRGGSSRSRLAADLIAQRGFMVVRRGFDQDEVRAFLDQVAGEVRALHRQLDEGLGASTMAALPAAGEPQPVDRLPIDEETLVALVGEETATVLRAARTAAADLRRRAETEAERIIDEARLATGDMRQEAETVLDGAKQQADLTAEEILRTARAEAEQVVARARAEVEELREHAEQERRLTVDGAQAVREKILGDLSRRRRVATVQIEQLRAGRERLLESYAVVRRTLEEVHEELQRADTEARAAADDAGRRAEADPDPDPPEITTSSDAGVRAGATPAHIPSGTDAPTAAPPDGGGAVDDESPDSPVRPESAPVGADEAPAGAEQSPAGAGQSSGGAGQSSGGAEPPLGGAPATTPALAGMEDGTIVSHDGIERVRVLRPEPPPGSPAADEVATEEPNGQGVEGMLQRIRAGRESSVESARQVLDRPAPPARSDRSARGARASGAARAGTATIAPLPATASTAAPSTAAPSTAAPITAAPVTAAPITGAPITAATAAGAAVGGAAVGGATVGGATESAASSGAPAAVATGRPGDEGLEPPRSDEDEALLQRRDEMVAETEAGLTKKLKRALQDEQNELLDRLRGARGAPKAATLLPDEPDHAARLAAAAQPFVEQACRAGMAFTTDGAPTDAAGQLGGEIAAEVAAGLVTPLRRRLTEAIRDNAGDEQPALVEAIGAVYRECKTQRVEPAVVDGVATAFAAGIYAATAPGTPLRWVVEDSDGPCPDCDDNALAGHLPRGEVFPTGQLRPPAHAGCRCLLTVEGPA